MAPAKARLKTAAPVRLCVSVPEAMPRLRSPPVQRPPSGAGGDDDDDNDDDEGEYGAESFDSPTPSLKGALGSSGNKPPSEKKKNVGFAGMAADGGDDDDDVADGGGGDDSDKQEALALGQSASKVSLAASESGKSLVEGMDLETFMKNASRKRDEDSAPSNTNDPSMRPLEGVSPTKTSADLALGLKLGYEELEEEGKSADRFKRQLVQAVADDDDDDDEEERLSSFMNRQTSKMPPPQRPKQLGGPSLKKQSDETAADSKGPITPAQYAYYASLLNRKVDVAALDGQPLRSVTDEDSARRVDALLNELIPSRAVKAQPPLKPKSNKIVPQQHEPQQRKTKPVGGASAAAAAAASASASSMMGPDGGRNQQYGLGAIGSKRSLGDSDDYPGGEVVGDSRYQQSLESQIATLKKDMRARDDRLSRLTEHSMMLSNHCDNLKAELAQMQQKLRSAELELDAKEQRASDAARLRKKAQKKSAKLAAEMENYDALVQTCESLQNREQALLEAVEALSTQNEDLIKKLKASMSRELELRSVGRLQNCFIPFPMFSLTALACPLPFKANPSPLPHHAAKSKPSWPKSTMTSLSVHGRRPVPSPIHGCKGTSRAGHGQVASPILVAE